MVVHCIGILSKNAEVVGSNPIQGFQKLYKHGTTNLFMNKRGQFYIIISLALSLVLFGLAYKTNYIEESVLSENFDSVSQNYIVEGTKLVNHALENQDDDIKEQIETFTQEYLSYAEQIDPNLGLLYVYSDDVGNVYVKNYLSEPVGSSNIGSGALGSSQEIIQSITLEIGGREFIHQVPIRAANFGDDWVSIGFGNTPFGLNIGGITHKFDLSGSNEFRVIIRTINGKEVSISSIQQNIN